MIKYIPQPTQFTYIEYNQITFGVDSKYDRITIDKDGCVYGWVGSHIPQNRWSGFFTHSNTEFNDTKTFLGQFERDDGKEFEPELFFI